jgi:hypothetical protein
MYGGNRVRLFRLNVGQQLKRFANVPAVREGQLLQVLVDHTTQILQRMEAQNAALIQSMNQLSGHVDQLSQKIDSIDNRVAAECVKAPICSLCISPTPASCLDTHVPLSHKPCLQPKTFCSCKQTAARQMWHTRWTGYCFC